MRTTALAVLLLLPAAGFAQAERYELGRRLKRFEAEWEKQTDPAARKRALAILPKASTQFLSLNLTEAARTVDDAYWALKAADPPAAGVRWLDALCVAPEKRAVRTHTDGFVVAVRPLYTVPGGPPAGATARLIGPQGIEKPVSLDNLPKAAGVSWGPMGSGTIGGFDLTITLETRLGGVELRNAVGVSRLEKLDTTSPDRSTVAGATTAAVRDLTDRVLDGEVLETDLPLFAWRSGVDRDDRPFYTTTPPPGGYGYSFPKITSRWLVVPTEKAATPCRLFVPDGLAKDKPVPLVVALHGAGGSENMFFESYGAGHIVKECAKRGWLLVSPRSGFLGTPPVAAIVEKLRDRYPIDPKRVYLVGHSMGAGQAIDLVQRHPGTFAAVASLGGGGRVRQKERFATLPVFVGVGTADFALKSSRSLVKSLADAGATKVTAKEYPDLEHLVIVREALPDLFQMFDN